MIEMTVNKFRHMYPEIWHMFDREMREDFITDRNYIVRVDPRSGSVEIGYRSDDWGIK